MQESQKASGSLVISGGDAAVVLDSGEEALYLVSGLVEVLVDEAGLLGVRTRGNHHLGSQLSDGSCKGVAVIAFVSHHRPRFVFFQQGLCLPVVWVVAG